ncbi:hypothetical protein FYW06_27775 [Bacillus paranthracis]|uniref:Uncharacterized protein n=1 Tax=Bacillus paranthracis TaxID=2026186 RepID=A0A5M9GHV6_9BACI|nr:hypothetical protein [Bacillus paranthracis]KAA8473249.1 hypothetical protein FYW06_27775 [Bacillus paranthracis]QPA42215.1 hypothetical protein INR14_29430 [Bacillus paranthracis]
MAKERIEMRIQSNSNDWNESEIIFDASLELPSNNAEKTEVIKKKAQDFANVYEKQVRWNYHGHLSGNYVNPK